MRYLGIVLGQQTKDAPSKASTIHRATHPSKAVVRPKCRGYRELKGSSGRLK